MALPAAMPSTACDFRAGLTENRSGIQWFRFVFDGKVGTLQIKWIRMNLQHLLA